MTIYLSLSLGVLILGQIEDSMRAQLVAERLLGLLTLNLWRGWADSVTSTPPSKERIEKGPELI